MTRQSKISITVLIVLGILGLMALSTTLGVFCFALYGFMRYVDVAALFSQRVGETYANRSVVLVRR